jgi:hypothetical protein
MPSVSVAYQATWGDEERKTLQQIAWLLGYSEIGAFDHAFITSGPGYRPAEREI